MNKVNLDTYNKILKTSIYIAKKTITKYVLIEID